MKQLPLTPELTKLIKASVGEDVDVTGFAVFEAISLNTKPLPGKGGSIFEGAVVSALTLRQMADSINAGNHLPLISDHQLTGEPKGRVFHADLMYGPGGEVELRTLFYLDPTEDRLIQKLNAGSLDEVSVSFLSSQMLCSECSFDYMGPEAEWSNIRDRTCNNGHTIGENGVHARLVGLSQFIELSLVARGAADGPKIVGKSESKLQPAAALRLAARGFNTDGLIVRASRGEEVVTTPFDPSKLITDLSQSQAQVIVLTQSETALKGQVTELTAARDTAVADRDAANARIAELETELAAAKEAPESAAQLTEAVQFLQTTLSKVIVASGGEAPAADALPKTITELKAQIEEKTANLTAILPVGGVARGAQTEDGAKPKLVASAFSTRK